MSESGARISLDFLEGRRGEALVRVLEREGVELHRAGREMKASCPFHAERTPSFYVNPSTGAYYCFGCDARGDAVTFVQKIRGLSFSDALEHIAGELGEAPSAAPAARAHKLAPERNVGAPWARLALHDDAGESYLAGRGLFFRDPEVLRFNIGSSGDSWLDARAREGYRVAFAVRRPGSVVQTISLRFALPGNVPAGKKTLALPGCSTKGAAIVSPAIEQLALGDPEFAGDELLLLEGGTDWLGASLFFGEAIANGELAPIWTLGVIGASNAAGVIEGFAPIIRWRTLLLGLDGDDAGEKAVGEAAQVARRIGAREILRIRPPEGPKDWAEAVRAGR